MRSSRRGPLALVGRGVKRNCINNCLLQNVHFEFGESRLGTQIGNVKGKAFCAEDCTTKCSFWLVLDPTRETKE